MRKLVCCAAGAGLLLSASGHAAPAASGMSAQIAAARTEARLALTETDMLALRRHVRRAINCLVGRDGAYLAVAGSACASGRAGVMGQLTDRGMKSTLDSAVNTLLSACNQGDIDYAHDLVEDGLATLAKVH